MSCCRSRKLYLAWGVSVMVAGFVVILIGSGVWAAAQPEEEMPAEMAEWMQAGQPNEHHEALNMMVGAFHAEMWFQMDPLAPREESEGEVHTEWLLDGRYLGSQFSTDFMGMPFEGHSVMGYDNINEHYFSAWIDNMSTGLFTEEGQLSDDGKTLTLNGSMTSPAGVKMTTKHVYTIHSDDKYTMEFWEAPKGEDLVNTGVITYTRM